METQNGHVRRKLRLERRLPKEIWKQYPGGVKVTVAFFDPSRGGVLVKREGRFGHTMPHLSLQQDQNLSHAVQTFAGLLSGWGVSMQMRAERPRILASLDEGDVLYVLILAQCSVLRRSLEVIEASNIDFFSGLSLSNPCAPHLSQALWGTH